MSTVQTEQQKVESTQKLDKWDKLANLLEYATDEVIADLKTKLKLDEICINGFANALIKQQKSVDEMTLGEHTVFNNFLKKIGFTSKEIRQHRSCVINGCPAYTYTIGRLMNHLIAHHNIKIKTLARLVGAIRDDTRVPKESILINLQTLHMKAD